MPRAEAGEGIMGTDPEPRDRDVDLVDLHALSRNGTARFGGKAVGLARLIALGLPVPPGFAVSATCLPPAAWSERARSEFQKRCRVLLDRGTGGPPLCFPNIEPRLAVRSSALDEDSDAHSFAGQFETVLHVKDPTEALEAAGRCVASGTSQRVAAYAGDSAPRPVGVVVQVQIHPRVAGVCFTVDPTGQDEAVVVEAVAGLGDALVSGRVAPESWRVYRNGLDTWESIRTRAMSAGVLNDAQARAVAALGHAIADRFGAPLDLEWAVDSGGELWWLQARPITAATRPRKVEVERTFDAVDDGPVSVWANFNVRETMPRPFAPLVWSVWRDVILPEMGRHAFGIRKSDPLFPHLFPLDLVGGRVYWNLNALFAVPGLGTIMRVMLPAIDLNTHRVVKSLQRSGILRTRKLPARRWKVLAGMALAGMTSLLGAARALLPGRTLHRLEAGSDRLAALPPVETLSDQELAEQLNLFTSPLATPFHNGLTGQVPAFAAFAIATRLFRHHPNAQQLLAVGTPGPTTEISLALDELVIHARPFAQVFEMNQDPEHLLQALEDLPGGAGWTARFHAFLRRFGHRGPGEFDLTVPRWADEPKMILDMVRTDLARPGHVSLKQRMAQLVAERRRAIDAAVAGSALWKRPFMRAAAWAVPRYMPLREAPKHFVMILFKRMSDAARELGRRWTLEGVLQAPDQVFLLTREEVFALAGGNPPWEDLHARLARRKAHLENALEFRPPDVVRSDGVPVVEAGALDEGGEDGVLCGTGVSGGRATGPVRILERPDPAGMEEGDVIVMEVADPGWTPLFPRAGAVIMEVGGAMCHAAIVARELGVPAVFGVREARLRLRNGQQVTVDGSAGRVTLR